MQADATDISAVQIRRLFMISYNRVFVWMSKGGMPFDIHTKQRRINLEQFREWVKENPAKLKGIGADRLRLLIEDEQVIEAIAAVPRYPNTRTVTQIFPHFQVFRTMREAAKACHISYSGLASALLKAERSGTETVNVCGVEFLVERAQSKQP
jgi:hypothetical protein